LTTPCATSECGEQIGKVGVVEACPSRAEVVLPSGRRRNVGAFRRLAKLIVSKALFGIFQTA
jgi:hypothetical protein